MSNETAPMIGQFSGPPGNAPRVALQRKETPVTPSEKQEAASPAASTTTTKSREEKYADFLKGLEEAGVTPVEARTIMDEILEKGYYTSTHQVRGKDIVIRSRNYSDTLRTQRFLEVESPTYAMNMDEIIMRYNTAASLVRFGEHTFEHPEDKKEYTNEEVEAAFDVRRKFIERLPSIMVGKLNTMVYNMDMKLAAVFAEGAPEDF